MLWINQRKHSSRHFEWLTWYIPSRPNPERYACELLVPRCQQCSKEPSLSRGKSRETANRKGRCCFHSCWLSALFLIWFGVFRTGCKCSERPFLQFSEELVWILGFWYFCFLNQMLRNASGWGGRWAVSWIKELLDPERRAWKTGKVSAGKTRIGGWM